MINLQHIVCLQICYFTLVLVPGKHLIFLLGLELKGLGTSGPDDTILLATTGGRNRQI